MKVLHILPGPEEGNSMIFAKRQIEFLSGQQIATDSFYLKSRTNLILLAKDFFRFRKFYKSFKPDIVHCHYGTATALFAAVSNSKPLVITFYGSDLNFLKFENVFKEIFGKLFSQLSALRASAIVCVSERLKQKLFWRKKNVTILPIGVNEKLFYPCDYSTARKKSGIDPDEKIILFNGNNPYVKRLDIAEATVKLVKKIFPTAHLLVLDGNVSLEKILLLLNASDCLLLCSDSEGSPTMIKEAMACNLPIVSSDVGDVKNCIRNTYPGAITLQNADCMSEEIIKILKSNVRSNGREVLIMEGLTEQFTSKKLIDIYKKILNQQ